MLTKTQLDKHTELRDAIKKGNTDVAKQLILNNAAVILNHKSSSHSLLHWAIIKFESTEIIEILLDKKIDVHAKNHRRQSPLNLAVQLNKIEVVKLLLNKGAHVGANLKLLIYKATKNGNEIIVKHLVDSGAKNNPSINLKNSLNLAIKKEYLKIVEYILPYCKFKKLNDKQIPMDIVLKDDQQYKHCVDLLLQYGFIISSGIEKNDNFIYSAVEKGYTKIVEELLKLGIDVNMRNQTTGLTLLHTACLNKHLEIVKLFINYKADINLSITKGQLSREDQLPSKEVRNLVGKTALHITAKNSDANLIKLLLDNGAEVKNDPNFFSIASIAIQEGSKEIVEILLNHGVDINVANADGKTLLHCCTMYYYQSYNYNIRHEVVGLLLQRGASVNEQNKNGETPLFYAVRNGYIKIVELLIKHNVDVQFENFYGNTALHISTEKDIAPICAEILLNNNAKIDAVNKKGKTPLHLAVDRDNVKIVQVFLDHNATVNLRDKYGKTPLYSAVERKNIEIVKYLLKKEADPNLGDNDGKTPLHIICDEHQEKNLEIINILLQYNADVNIADVKGRTPLFKACEVGSNPLIELLLKKNADVNHTDLEGTTPICIAAQRSWGRDATIVELLLKYKANVYSVNQEGETLLHIVTDQHRLDIVENLIRMDININSVDKQGRTAFHLAAEKAYEEIVLSLLKNGADVNASSENHPTALHYVTNHIARLQRELRDYRANSGNVFHGRILSQDYADDNIDFYKCEIYSYKRIQKILKEHIIKLKCAKLNVNEQNLDQVSGENEDSEGSFDDDDDDTLGVCMCDFKYKCEKEIGQLMMENVGRNHITFYDLLTRNFHRITRYTKNENIMKSLELNIYSKKFPLYIDIIKNRFAEGVRRSELLEISQRYFRSSIFYGLPHNCKEEVFSYLNFEELKKFIKAMNPSYYFNQ